MGFEHPVTELKHDHRLIEKVLSALERKLAGAEEFPSEFAAQALAFFAEFADGHHHFREEEVLFPALAASGVSVESGPIGVMLHEHTLGRKLLAGIRENLEGARKGDGGAQTAVRSYAAQYIELLRGHIWKEDNILFAMAERVLDNEAVRAVAARFQAGGGTDPAVTERHAAFAAAL